MKDTLFLPEGCLWDSPENKRYLASTKMLEKAMEEGRILEAPAVFCDGETLELKVDLPGAVGIIPKEEAGFPGNSRDVKDIAVISRVGRPVCFTVKKLIKSGGDTVCILSRRDAQKKCLENYVSRLAPGDVVRAAVTHLDPFGAFVDIGCGIASLLTIDRISVSRISHPSDRLKKGQLIWSVVKSREEDSGRICMSLRELLGTWEENVAPFEVGSTVSGRIRSIENYGVFVELSPNLAGLAERRGDVSVGDSCAVYVKSILRDRMKVKLALIDSFPDSRPPVDLRYYITGDSTPHISRWRYSPAGCEKLIETVFEQDIS